MFRFEELDIWKLASEYGDDIYNISKKLPINEQYNIIDQLKRAAVSISNNIVEGSGATTNKSFKSFLDTSISSALETVNLLYFAQRRKYIAEHERQALYKKSEILIRKIRAFKNSLR